MMKREVRCEMLSGFQARWGVVLGFNLGSSSAVLQQMQPVGDALVGAFRWELGGKMFVHARLKFPTMARVWHAYV